MATISTKKPTKKSNLVKIKNDLVESFVKSNNLTALKILFYLAYDCETVPDGKIVVLKMSSKDICEYCKVDAKTLRRNLKQMQETSISWRDEKAESFVSVLPKVVIEYGGTIELTMFQEVLQMIIDVKDKYTTVNAEQLMRLNSKHSTRMLLLLERINGYDADVGKRARYELSELNLLFGTKYKRLGQFEQEILIPVKLDLDNNSKLSFIYRVNYDKDSSTSAGRPYAKSITLDLISSNLVQPSLF